MTLRFKDKIEVAADEAISLASDRADRMSIGVAMLLIAGAAVGFWLALDILRSAGQIQRAWRCRFTTWAPWLSSSYWVGFLWLGLPLLLLTARKSPGARADSSGLRKGRRPGCCGRRRFTTESRWTGGQASMSAVCFFYGTPPMALYVTLTLLAGGHLSASSPAQMRRSWQETFGLLLGLAWACTGLYIISLFYRQDFIGK